jgi:phage baseplate assembly protein W
MSTGITSPYWSPAIGTDGVVTGLDDISQCIGIILTTPKGSDPHRPAFACDIYQYVDLPQNVSGPKIVREARRAILAFEPRVKDVNFTLSYTVGGISILVDWTPNSGGSVQRTVVNVPRSA